MEPKLLVLKKIKHMKKGTTLISISSSFLLNPTSLPCWRESWKAVFHLCHPGTTALPWCQTCISHLGARAAQRFNEVYHGAAGPIYLCPPSSSFMHKGCSKYFPYVSSSLLYELFHSVENKRPLDSPASLIQMVSSSTLLHISTQ